MVSNTSNTFQSGGKGVVMVVVLNRWSRRTSRTSLLIYHTICMLPIPGHAGYVLVGPAPSKGIHCSITAISNHEQYVILESFTVIAFAACITTGVKEGNIIFASWGISK